MAQSEDNTPARRPGRPRKERGLHEIAQPTRRRETKLEAFRRLAKHRVTNAVKAIGLVEKLGNSELYEVRPEDVEKVIGTLRAAVEECEHSLLNRGKKMPVLEFEC